MKSPYFLYERYPALESCKDDIEKAAQALKETFKNGGTIYCCGNGGSAADCEHIVGELMKGFLKKRPLSGEEKERLAVFGEEGEFLAGRLQGAIPAVSLVNSVGLGTAFANDVAPELIFAQQVYEAVQAYFNEYGRLPGGSGALYLAALEKINYGDPNNPYIQALRNFWQEKKSQPRNREKAPNAPGETPISSAR